MALVLGCLVAVQARRLLHDSQGFFPSPGHAADALWVANLVVLKALWRIGDPYRTHLIAPESSTVRLQGDVIYRSWITQRLPRVLEPEPQVLSRRPQCCQCFSGPVSNITAAGEAGRQVNR